MRLTMAMKDQIVSKVLAETIDKRIKERLEAEKAFGDSVVKFIYEPYAELMEQLPSTAFSTDDSVMVRWSDDRYAYKFVSTNGHKAFYRNLQLDTNRKSTWMKILNNLETQKDELNQQRRDLSHELRQVVNSVTTVKRLLEVWPEGKKWIEEVCLNITPNLPMVTTDNLNKKLCILLNDPESLPCKGA